MQIAINKMHKAKIKLPDVSLTANLSFQVITCLHHVSDEENRLVRYTLFYKRVGDNHGSVISRASFFVSVEAAQQMSPVLVYLDDI